MRLRVLSASQVRAALPMRTAIDTMAAVFGALSAGRVRMPPRGRLPTNDGVTLVMPAQVAGSGDAVVKVVSVHEGNPHLGLPTINAVVVVLDAATGVPRAVLDGTELTAIRTGAAGGLAADILARGDASVAAVFGAGVQARRQIEALLAIRPITEVRLVARTGRSAQRLAAELATWRDAPEVRLGLDPEAAVSGADIVVTATSSVMPVFPGNALSPGTHVTAVGAYLPTVRELDDMTMRRAARVVVDSRAAAAEEAGDLLLAGVGPTAEIGEIVNGTAAGRGTEDEITVFKSVGVAAQDAAAATAVLAAAEQSALGTTVEL